MFKYILYLVLKTNRIYNDEPILNTTSCKAFCSEKDGRLIDSDLFYELETKIEDEDKSNEDVFSLNRVFNFGKRKVLLNIKYDFEKKQWQNGITKTVLDNTMWLIKNNSSPVYPILNDILGKTFKQLNDIYHITCQGKKEIFKS